ncbi:class I SAM-dependent methyltransferase [Schlegelella sp. ID0723]|uniref:Class I SAM-dependent methyltransferase n=1 Tax=Piscinibacter koreensis TaxID=2742824 RepID=A0A7Y6NRV6_9BURK|nr:class I SAM-dependent methyltransferase [Schlegelella koreensis]
MQSLRDVFATRHRFSKGLVERAQAAFGPAWSRDFESMLVSLFPGDDRLGAAARGYAAFAFDSMRRQKAFEAEREYPNKTYADAAREVYFNEEHMEREYLPGLLLSHFLWPHHYRQIQFFDTAFLSGLQRAESATFAEVGIGTALFSRRILERTPSARGDGYDISPSSCRYAEQHVAAIGAADRYVVHCQDILETPMTPVPWLVCVEVLEHLEDPVGFLRALRSALQPGGKAFITAAINAAHSDHIYLYRSAAEVEQDLERAGFTIEQSFAATAFAPPAPGVPVPVAAAFVAYAA